MSQKESSTRVAFDSHPRNWRDYRYVYPVISRRSKGLSVGINLCPGKNCNYDCIYCQVNRDGPGQVEPINFELLAAELDSLLVDYQQVFEDQQYCNIPAEMQIVKDIAFSGDGEPTASPAFPAVAGLVAELRSKYRLNQAKIVLLTNACYLRTPAVLQTLAFLDQHNGEIWAKLDAGTQKYFEHVNNPNCKLKHVLENILSTARVRPIVIQSLFMRIHEELPPAGEVNAYIKQLQWLLDNGARIKLLQLYTVARQPARDYVDKLTEAELEKIAAEARKLSIPVETFI